MKRKRDSEEVSGGPGSPYASNKSRAEPASWPLDLHSLQAYEFQLKQAACLQRPRVPGKPVHRLAPLKQPWEAALKLVRIIQQQLQQQQAQTRYQQQPHETELHVQLLPEARKSAANISQPPAASPAADIQHQWRKNEHYSTGSEQITVEGESTVTDSSRDVADCGDGTTAALLDDGDSVAAKAATVVPMSCTHAGSASASCIASCSQHSECKQQPTLRSAPIDDNIAETTQCPLAGTKAREADATQNNDSCGYDSDSIDKACSGLDVSNSSGGSSGSSDGSGNSSGGISVSDSKEEADNTTCAYVNNMQQQQLQQAVCAKPNTATVTGTSSEQRARCEPPVLQSSVEASTIDEQEQQEQSQYTPSPPPAATLAAPNRMQHNEHAGGRQQHSQLEQLHQTPVFPEQQRIGARAAQTPADCHSPGTPQLACLLAMATAEQHPSCTTTATAAGSGDAAPNLAAAAEAEQRLAAAKCANSLAAEQSPITLKNLQQPGGACTPADQVRPQNWLLLTPSHLHSSSKLQSAAAAKHKGEVVAISSMQQQASQYGAAAAAPHTPEVTPVVPASAQQQQPLPGSAQRTTTRRALGSMSQRRAALLMSPVAAMKALPQAQTGSTCSSSSAVHGSGSTVVKSTGGKDGTDAANLFDSWLQHVNSSCSTSSRRGLLPPLGPIQSAVKQQRQVQHQQQRGQLLSSSNGAASGQEVVCEQLVDKNTAEQPQQQQQRQGQSDGEPLIAAMDMISDATQLAAGGIQKKWAGSKPPLKRRQCESTSAYKQQPSGASLASGTDDTAQHRDTMHLPSNAVPHQRATSSSHSGMRCRSSEMCATVGAAAPAQGDSCATGTASALLEALSTINSGNEISCDASPAVISASAVQQPTAAISMEAVAAAVSVVLPSSHNSRVGNAGRTSSSPTDAGCAAELQAEVQQGQQQLAPQQQQCQIERDAVVLKFKTSGHAAAQNDSGSAAATCAAGFVPCSIPASALLGVTRRMAYVRFPKTSAHTRTGGTAKQARSGAAAGSGGIAAHGIPARSDGAGNAPTSETLEQRLREAYLDMQLAAAAADGAAWADLDLAGLPRQPNQERLHEYKEIYDEARSRLLRNRPFSEVARLEQQLAAEWQWLQRVRHLAAQAASSCEKQSILRRPAPPVELSGWHVDVRDSAAAGTSQQVPVKQRPRVHFNCFVHMSPAPAANSCVPGSATAVN